MLKCANMERVFRYSDKKKTPRILVIAVFGAGNLVLCCIMGKSLTEKEYSCTMQHYSLRTICGNEDVLSKNHYLYRRQWLNHQTCYIRCRYTKLPAKQHFCLKLYNWKVTTQVGSHSKCCDVVPWLLPIPYHLKVFSQPNFTNFSRKQVTNKSRSLYSLWKYWLITD